MFIQRVLAPALATAYLALCAAPSAAQSPAPAGAPANAALTVGHPVGASQLIKVSHCHPSLNLMQSGGYYAGYPAAPYGFYGYGAYGRGYWPDVYGAGFYQPPVTTSNPQLAIDYVNVSSKVMKEIEFGLIVNGVLRAEVKDVGTFSPHAEIKHRFGISANVFPIQSGLPQCAPLRIKFDDGSHWRNPHLPPKNHNIYLNPGSH